MKNSIFRLQQKRCMLLAAFAFPLAASFAPVNGAITKQEVSITTQQVHTVLSAKLINTTTVEVRFSNNQTMLLDFYGDNIFRIFQDNTGGILRDPKADPEAKILVDNPRKALSGLNLKDADGTITCSTDKISIRIDKKSALLQVVNLETNQVVLQETEPIGFEKGKVVLTLKENPEEYFYGGGVQNGRFSHKGKIIAIENQNSWTDGGVASPNPYYWSTNGYAMMWHTFKKGKYDFGGTEKGTVQLHHETDYLDLFLMVSETPVALLNDFYQLTGNPVLLPKFGFYQGHLNAYNRDYWKEDSVGVLFEDGKRYKESQKENGGIKESLNGEHNNYMFSARAVIDRYKKHDMPFGWLLPNDGYGAGYGQTETIDGNIQNLKSLADYAQQNGVEIGLWTQSDLHPKPEVSALLQRDIVKEVKEAGVRVLKTDVAWVGAGYSFGLNGITDVANIMTYYGNNARPFIISLDGWAGSQRYAGIWSGDQTGGVWEYIRFHIPTYIGSGLSGQPNICSDTDGIFGGKNMNVNIRDFQWKTYSPMELNMDGWGSNAKYPHALGEPATSINRWYLKLKSELMPYAYSIAKESVDGMPMIRAMFLEYPNSYTNGKATQYQYLYGPNLLIAPIYQETNVDAAGNDMRNGIYLPKGTWIDYFTGEKYDGECVINNFDTPIWKLPVFVKNGAIIPLTNPNNNVAEIDNTNRIYEIYPFGSSSFTEYDDDGVTEAYRLGAGVTTRIESNVDDKNNVTISIDPTAGTFNGFVKEKSTELRINVTAMPKKITATVGKKKQRLQQANSMEQFNAGTNVYYYDAAPNLNRFATKDSEFEDVVITKTPQLLIKLAPTDITANATNVTIKGFEFNPINKQKVTTGTLSIPTQGQVTKNNIEAYTLNPTWNKVEKADFYEIEFNNMLYTTIKGTELLFEDLTAETDYDFKLRAVNKDGYSDWAQFAAKTKSNPLEFAIRGVEAKITALDQSGSEIAKLFDFDESNMWHTKWGTNSVPFDVIIDLNTINQLDKFHYIPRKGNGTLLAGTVYYSNDKETWTKVDTFNWKNSNDVKVFDFKEQPTTRYIKLAVTNAAGGFGSGKEMYIFKVPNTESYLPGDINNDRLLDVNDLTSYTNYTGLRKGDADFEGYISNGDINKNNLIDAYDISVLTTQLKGGVTAKDTLINVAGKLELSSAKQSYKKGELIEITVKGTDLAAVNALSFALPYDPKSYAYEGVQVVNMKEMENLTYDRLHTNGVKSLYPTFVNIGEKELLEGTQTLFVLKFKAKKDLTLNLELKDGLLINQELNTCKF